MSVVRLLGLLGLLGVVGGGQVVYVHGGSRGRGRGAVAAGKVHGRRGLRVKGILEGKKERAGSLTGGIAVQVGGPRAALRAMRMQRMWMQRLIPSEAGAMATCGAPRPRWSFCVGPACPCPAGPLHTALPAHQLPNRSQPLTCCSISAACSCHVDLGPPRASSGVNITPCTVTALGTAPVPTPAPSSLSPPPAAAPRPRDLAPRGLIDIDRTAAAAAAPAEVA